MSKPIRVGIIGLGRSGWAIHANAMLKRPEQFKIVSVTDAIPERSAKSAEALGCRVHPDLPSLLADAEVELVVVATFNHLHALHARQALEAGKHVLCEKPFGLTVADVDGLMAAADRAGKIVAPFQQRRFQKDFLKVKEVLDSGILGRIVHVRTCWHGFKRRWDWQTDRAFAGGALNNNGPHPLDHALCLFGDGEPEVWAQASRNLCSGDAEDHLKFILYGAGHPTVEVELTDVWAYPQDRWVVSGTSGGLHGSEQRLEWKWTDFASMPPRPLDLRPTPDRSYNSEKIDWQTASWAAETAPAGAGAPPPPEYDLAFYDKLHASLTRGLPLAIPPAEIRRRIAVLERIREKAGLPIQSHPAG